MKKLLFVFLVQAFFSCQNSQNTIEVSQPVVASGDHVASGPYFTRNHLGNPVLCWTEGEEGRQQLWYAVYNDGQKKFTDPVSIPVSVGTGIHAESMNKIAFRNDGTVIAVFERKHPTEKNKYAGSILYSQSFDDGKSWTKEKYLHSDTLASNSRSFFDIATLPDGEIGAVWVDSRFKSGKEGSALFFTKTHGKDGFQPDHPIGETVCECCRTDLYVDARNNVHVVYRDIESTVNGHVRDFVHAVSTDNGSTFTSSQKISPDNWLINGCPHTGASMTVNDEGLVVAWFTAGGQPGLYLTKSLDNGSTFQSRQLLSENARHPQIVSSGKSIVAVWDETQQHSAMHAGHSDHSAGNHNTSGVITFSILNDDKENGSIKIPASEGAEFPVVYSINSHLSLISYSKNDQVIVRVVKH